MIFAVQCDGEFYKRTYDSWNGYWTADSAKAARWKTRAGALAAAEKQRRYAVMMQRPARAQRIRVIEL